MTDWTDELILPNFSQLRGEIFSNSDFYILDYFNLYE